MFAYCNNNPIILTDSTGGEPTRTIDTDGDGEDDCYIYEYTYTELPIFGCHTFPREITGCVYIYKNKSKEDFESMEYPEGFNKRTDLLVGDWTHWEDPTMYAYQAQNVKIQYRESIIDCLNQYDQDFDTPWDRTESSLLTEWESHMMFGGIFGFKRAQNVDFNNKEEGKGYFYFMKKAVIALLP